MSLYKKKFNIDSFMVNYFPKLSNELQIYIYGFILNKFNYIYRQYKINPKFLKYNDKSLHMPFYQRYYITNNIYPPAKYALIGDIIVHNYIYYNYLYDPIYTVVGYYNWDYENFRTMKCNYKKIIYDKSKLFSQHKFLLVIKGNNTLDLKISPYFEFKIVQIAIE